MTHKWPSVTAGIAMALKKNFSFFQPQKTKLGSSNPSLSKHKGSLNDRASTALCTKCVPARGTGSPLTNMSVHAGRLSSSLDQAYQNHKAAASDEGLVLG